MPKEPPSHRVYQNSLLLSLICSHIPSKSDLITCLTLSRSGFCSAVKALYGEVEEDVLGRVLGKRCALTRLQTYAMAVRTVLLTEKTYPNEIDISGYREVYPNLSKIKFRLGYNEGRSTPISTISLYDLDGVRSSKNNAQGSGPPGDDTGARLQGELHLVIHDKPNALEPTLLSPSFAITGPQRRFKLTCLSLGPAIAYDEPLPQSTWTNLEGLLDATKEEDMRTVFADLEELETRLHLGPGMEGLAICGMPKIKRLSLIMDESICSPSIKSTGVSEACRPNAHQLEHLSLIVQNRPHASLAHFKASGAAFRSTVGAVRLDEKEEKLGMAHLEVPLKMYSAGKMGSVSVQDASARNRVGKITICVQEAACEFSAYQVACYMLRVWPSDLEVKIEPFFFKPSERLRKWMKDVLQIRGGLRRLVVGGNGVGFRRVKARGKGGQANGKSG